MENQIELKPSARRVQDALNAANVTAIVREMPASTRTAEEAAAAIGCMVGQIVKSLIFMGAENKQAHLVLASGVNRVNEVALGEKVGEKILRATPDFVREQTGFAIGGVPPLGHIHPLTTWMDESLLTFDEVWAAAGTPNSVFAISPQVLSRLTDAKQISL